VTAGRLYADENVPRRLVEALRRLGYDVLTCYEAGHAGQRIPDEEVLRFAAAQGRAVLTLNRRDFFRLHQANPNHAGIVACTEDPDCEAQATRVDRDVTREGDLRGKVVRVYRPPG
jgi:predicted nuclease of predicted toxin-antitoxin system